MFAIITLELAVVCLMIGLVQFLMTPKKVKLIGGDREPPAIICLGGVLFFISFASIAFSADSIMKEDIDSYIAHAKVKYIEICLPTHAPEECELFWKTKGANVAWGKFWSPKE